MPEVAESLGEVVGGEDYPAVEKAVLLWEVVVRRREELLVAKRMAVAVAVQREEVASGRLVAVVGHERNAEVEEVGCPYSVVVVLLEEDVVVG